MSSLTHGGGAAPSRTFWRSLDQLADTAEFRRFVEREFPGWADEMLRPASRRNFLKYMAASMALAGMTGCRWPREEIVPFAARPEGRVPGEPLQYATAMDLRGAAIGLLATSFDGRPVKIEGNPDHAGSLGATGVWHQAAVLELFDPDRSEHPVQRGRGPARWEDFEAFAGPWLDALRAAAGRGLRVLAEASSSPSLREMRSRLLRAFPEARWHEYEPVSRDHAREGARLAFGSHYRTHLALDQAEVIVSLDEDFLHHHPEAVRNAREFVRGRDADAGAFSRLHMVESVFSLTGSVADRRTALPSRMIPVYAVCLAAELFLELGVELPPGAQRLARALDRVQVHPLYTRIDFGFARELVEHRGRSLVVAGPRQPAEVHALVHVINDALGNVGRTVRYTADPDPERGHHQQEIRALARDMADGAVEALVVLGGNPAFTAPADLDFGSLLDQVPTSIHLSLYEDETSQRCTWHLPRAHFLESWGDARDWRGTVCMVQPLIQPLLEGRSDLELLALLCGAPASGHEIVRRTFAAALDGADTERAWVEALHAGVRTGTAWAEQQPRPGDDLWAERLKPVLMTHDEWPEDGCELVFVEDSRILDGRFANNGWLQELPDPLTKLTWDNAALLAPQTAEELGVGQGDVVRLSSEDARVELPVFLLPGQAPRSITVWLGHGRQRGGRVARGAGFDVYPLRTGAALDWVDVRVERTGRRQALATTQDHFALDTLGERERAERAQVLVREVELTEYRADPQHAMHHGHEVKPVDLWRSHDYPGLRWGMAIDLNACIGCNACIVACQAENNIPVVGRDEVARGREMHWIRVDRYFSGEVAAPEVSHQPLTCHHCENAPCETVCPVAATVHDSDGLNVMVYNRCVGTRYCMNNCPYKVRRFNFFNNHKHESALQTMVYNPEVTVRSRGVMEKCTFCVQRIQRAKIRAKNEWVRGERQAVDGRLIRDGEFTTACAQACPTRAIAFGDLNDPTSTVRKWQESARAYALLGEWNVKPRTRYLARVRNRGNGGSHHGSA